MYGKNTKKVNEIKNFLFSQGWNNDRWGHFKKIENDREYRYKFQKSSLRLEYSQKINGKKEWRGLRSNYYKNIEIKDNKLTGLLV